MDTFLDILQVSSWSQAPLVLLDLAIVYYIVYRTLLLIKGTRAAQMLLGMLLIILFFFLSGNTALDLRVTNWLLDKFIANAIIIIVIIFQNDIRRALAQAGSRTSFFAQQSSFQETHALEEVVKAASMLGARRIGALIALEREADLSAFADEGIRLDATVSKDLLFSIFVPEHQNPLHDGAVIIQEGRICAAGCVLPLTDATTLERSLGTRHRAGIGLSEGYDAGVVIVSEESGAISVAYSGELYQALETTELRDLLQKIFRSKSDDKGQGLGEVLDRLRVGPLRRGAREARPTPAREEVEA